MNRIEDCFAKLKLDKRKGFIVYLGAGDPNLETTGKLALAFEQAGVDILELGVPFSDPLADGLVNQLAAQRGLESGTTPPRVLELVASLRKQTSIPLSSISITTSFIAMAWNVSFRTRRKRVWMDCWSSTCPQRKARLTN